MIKQYNDHAANERTYLAWLRTGIAIIAFGFVLERFDIFLHTIVLSLRHTPPAGFSHAGREAGVALVLVGVIAIATAVWRFRVTNRLISAEKVSDYSPRSAVWLGMLILILGLLILGYVTHLLLVTR